MSKNIFRPYQASIIQEIPDIAMKMVIFISCQDKMMLLTLLVIDYQLAKWNKSL